MTIGKPFQPIDLVVADFEGKVASAQGEGRTEPGLCGDESGHH